MAQYKEVPEADKKCWDELAAHPMQSWAWGEFRSKRQPISRLGKYENGKLVKVFLAVWTKLPKLDYYFGYVPMSGMPDEEDLGQLRGVAIKKSAIGIRLEPNVRVEESRGGSVTGLIKGRGLFKKQTYLWNLSQSEEELQKAMHQKCRYNIKVAQKHGVTIKKDDLSLSKHLELLFEGTVKRQKVGMHDENYHLQMMSSLGDIANLYVAEYKGEVISTMMVFKWREWAYYAYGGNSLKHKEIMAPTLLLWEVAKSLKAGGIKIFDLWGAEEGKGFSRFKQQFGADLVEMVGSYDLQVNKIAYAIFRFLEEARWRIRHR